MRNRFSLLAGARGRVCDTAGVGASISSTLSRLSTLSLLVAIVGGMAPTVGCARTRGASATAAAAKDLSRREDFHDVAVTGTDGRTLPLVRALNGRPALVNFWAPWCQPCVRELPRLQRLAATMEPCGAAILGVAVGETPAAIASYAPAHGLTYPQFTDEQFRLADALGQSRIPTTVVFDRAGHVVFTGESLDARAIAALRAAVAGVADPVRCASLP